LDDKVERNNREARFHYITSRTIMGIETPEADMSRVKLCIGMMALVSLGACAVPPPTGPSIAAMPGNGKSFEAFQADDNVCRLAASQSSGGTEAAQAGTNAAVGSAALGTALGAGAGALFGSVGGAVGTGAAIGAGTGLLAGTAVGASGAQYSAASLQRQYDVTYAQCMFAKGNTVQRPYVPVYGGYYGPRPYYGYGYGY
jgi:Glycine-zipper domain